MCEYGGQRRGSDIILRNPVYLFRESISHLPELQNCAILEIILQTFSQFCLPSALITSSHHMWLIHCGYCSAIQALMLAQQLLVVTESSAQPLL